VADHVVERFGIADGGDGGHRRVRLDELQQPRRIGRWVVAGVAIHRQGPPVVLLRGQREGGGPPGDRADQYQPRRAERAGTQPRPPADVRDAQVHALLGRRRVAQGR